MKLPGSYLMLVLVMAALPAAAEPQWTAVPAGDLEARIDLVAGRMLDGTEPKFTPDFVLADVMLRPDYPRRFSNYSGDLSGRVIGAFAEMASAKSAPYVDGLVAEALKCQKADGRFGAETLQFEPQSVGSEHMALLWGNGRLLVGFMEYHRLKADPAVLESSKRLGDFLLSAVTACSNDEVRNRVLGLGASGLICFSQLNEGLVMLANATGDARYLDACRSIQTWFAAERGKQHTHGYLTTLRGFVMQYEATQDTALLALVEDLYHSLTASPELMVYGGVKEFFGDPNYECDEGCSEADFLRLSLQLWRVTETLEYLERAEHILYNQFYANQYATGDFGHHIYTSKGIGRRTGQGRAWWCCTMHGLRAFRDVVDSVITGDANHARINLFESVKWSCGESSLATGADRNGAKGLFHIAVEKAPDQGIAVSVRIPEWMSNPAVLSDGTPIDIRREGDYLQVTEPLRAGRHVDVTFDYNVQFIMRDGTRMNASQLTKEPVEAMVQYGPWILGVDEHFDPLFLSEPWSDNVVFFPSTVKSSEQRVQSPLAVNAAHLSCDYVHGGYPDVQRVTLRPVAERTLHAPQDFITWLRIQAAP